MMMLGSIWPNFQSTNIYTDMVNLLELSGHKQTVYKANGALRRKLQSKSEAVLILSKDLDKCRTERDQFKLMAEQLQYSYSHLKRKTHEMGNHRIFLHAEEKGMTATEALNETLEQNKALHMQVEDLKQQLQDAYGDIKVLRAGNTQFRLNVAAAVETHSAPDRQKEELLQQLEALNTKYKLLEADFQALLDEKEEVVNQRDVFKCKAHRLNYELGNLLKSDRKECIDVDALIMENRYLHDRLKQVQGEQQVTKQTLVKYKGMLDKKRSKDTVRLGVTSAAGMVVTHKQVQQLLEKTAPDQLPNTPATLDQLKSLCLALLEALGDKSLNLAHQKKTNKILATRIVELETLAASCGAPVSPSAILLEGYSSADVDQDMSQMLSEQVDVECQISVVPVDTETNSAIQSNPKNSDPQFRASEENGSGDANCDLIAVIPRNSRASRVGGVFPSTYGKDTNQFQCDPLPPQVQQLLEQALEDLIHTTSTEDSKNKIDSANGKGSESTSEKSSHKTQENMKSIHENHKDQPVA